MTDPLLPSRKPTLPWLSRLVSIWPFLVAFTFWKCGRLASPSVASRGDSSSPRTYFSWREDDSQSSMQFHLCLLVTGGGYSIHPKTEHTAPAPSEEIHAYPPRFKAGFPAPRCSMTRTLSSSKMRPQTTSPASPLSSIVTSSSTHHASSGVSVTSLFFHGSLNPAEHVTSSSLGVSSTWG